jgi:hypothetical protein
MIAVTERAKEHLLDVKRSARINEPEVGLRLKPAATGEWQLFPDQAVEGDQIVEHGGSKLLLIGPDASDALGDRQVDCQETAPGQVKLVLSRRNEPAPDTRRKPSI